MLSWAALQEQGRNQEQKVLQARLESLAVNRCCHLVYTSGTTGMPKVT